MDARRRAELIVAVSKWPLDPPRGAVTRFARQHGVSREWVHDIRRRLAADGLEATLLPRSHARRTNPQAIPRPIVELACRTRLELAEEGWDCGPLSVQQRMRERGVQPPSRATLARIFTAEGLVTPAPRKRPRSSYRRFQHAFPNECWQLDAFETRLADGAPAVVFQVTDDHARFAIASRAARSENQLDALAVVTTGIDRHGVPQRLEPDPVPRTRLLW